MKYVLLWVPAGEKKCNTSALDPSSRWIQSGLRAALRSLNNSSKMVDFALAQVLDANVKNWASRPKSVKECSGMVKLVGNLFTAKEQYTVYIL